MTVPYSRIVTEKQKGVPPAMDCERAEKLIQPYVQDKMPENEMEEFITHVRNCPDCYDELETYFIIRQAARYLDDDDRQSYNLRGLLAQDLREKERRIQKKKRRNVFFTVLILVLAVLLIVFTLHYLDFVEIPWLKGFF